MKNLIRIANAGGFWGDDLGAFRRQLEGGEIDYISIDYLAEITMSILRKQQLKDKNLGYVTDFIKQMVDVAPLLKEKNVKVIVNAGGINPIDCGRKLLSELKKIGIELKVAIIEGDNITEELSKIYPEKAWFQNMETGESFENIMSKVQTANVYLGVAPIVKALESGVDVVIAGRVTDTSITLAPMIYEFGWQLNDWDKLASGIIAGHIIECGGQATGGNFTDWHKVESWDNFGYPIVEVNEDSTFVVTKHPHTGGLVSVDTVKEQLVYEMGDPANYISPDVVVSFKTINLEQVAPNRVRVFGVKGKPATPYYKVSMAYEDGYKSASSIMISGSDALAKAKIFAETFWKRLKINFEKTNTEFIGFNACHKSLSINIEPNEIMLRFSVFDHDINKIKAFSTQIAPLILTGPQGVCVTGGRPSAQEVMTYYPTLIPKKYISPTVCVLDSDGGFANIHKLRPNSFLEFEMQVEDSHVQKSTNKAEHIDFRGNDFVQVKLKDLCLARSGDKGDTSNIGVIARNPEIYEYLKRYLTANAVQTMFADFCKGQVLRYELDNLLALNFLLEESLDGGGTKSLMIDAQGKTYASALLNQLVSVPKNFIYSYSTSTKKVTKQPLEPTSNTLLGL